MGRFLQILRPQHWRYALAKATSAPMTTWNTIHAVPPPGAGMDALCGVLVGRPYESVYAKGLGTFGRLCDTCRRIAARLDEAAGAHP